MLRALLKPSREERIERYAEYRMDHLDKEFMSGRMSNEEYDRLVGQIDSWAKTKVEEMENLERIRDAFK